LVVWAVLSACIFCAINFFFVPQFPIVGQYIGIASVRWSVGVSALIMIIGLVFGGSK
jgi:hypothetical protein